MHKIRIVKGYFNGCIGILEGYHYNKAIVKIEVTYHNSKDTLTLLMKTNDYKIIEDIV